MTKIENLYIFFKNYLRGFLLSALGSLVLLVLLWWHSEQN